MSLLFLDEALYIILTMKKQTITEQDYIKANRKASRDEEIALEFLPLPADIVKQK